MTEEKKHHVDCDICGDRIEASKLLFHKATAHPLTEPLEAPWIKETPEQATERRHRELTDALKDISFALVMLDQTIQLAAKKDQ